MSQDSQHGKWTMSSSEDEDDAPAPAVSKPAERPTARALADTNEGSKNMDALIRSSQKSDPIPSTDIKSESSSPAISSKTIGSEARQAAHSNQHNPVKFETKVPSPAVKRKKETEESGWALSSSDDERPDEKASQTKRRSPSPKRKKVEDKRPPSPHGPSYYKEEPEEFFETSLPPENTFRFYLTKVTGIEKKYNNGALHIKEILSPLFGTLKESVQFNYCFDIPWMVQQYPPEFRDKPVMIVHGEKRESKARLIQQAQPYGHIRFCQAKLDIAFGTHHTKMMLLWYEEGFRVVILTSNLIRADWYQKTQGLWLSPLYPRLPEDSPASAGESPTYFKRDLVEYLEAYRSPELAEWIERIKEHDLSETRVYLIGSAPGRYQGADMERWGHLRLRKLLRENTRPILGEEAWPIIGQFSSIGSMGIDKTKWLAAEFQQTLATLGSAKKSSASSETTLHLVYPSVDNVRTSLEGYPAGGSLPYSIQTAQRQLWLHSYFHRWSSESSGRGHAMPHIKTYMRTSPDFTELAWFLVTSANLSKAAWGGLEKNNTQIMVRSYELGVLYLPSAFNMTKFTIQKNPFPATSSSSSFPVPIDLPPQRYSSKDQPWIWNIPYTQAPDTHGNVWVPS
ncbi:tyrosyl-DNA phosphodiesterase 1 [Conger conger]|uniref:tyrosyl-DNA phosphodiesterase 1 n=1 Tax=Conger conger TaxID=82655 RepID=UPI002A59836E|nr:tyrosyl-DNA phosphodiesterase 1 [Conger conger]XP_061071982.1 tyrosyl-DNA phosphodiesterase 1 [Conger conger]